MSESEQLTEHEAAQRLGYSSRWLANLRRSGRVRYQQVVKGGKVFYRAEWLEELMSGMRHDPQDGGPRGITSH